MFLRTLGGLALQGAGFHRPKPLLLLAYLALEGPKDRRYLADLFWMGAANARQSLAMALTQLRQAHPDLVRTAGARVWTEVASDAQRLLEAATTQDWVEVLALYRGTFLEGVDVPGVSLELEEWIYGTREFLGDKTRTALLHQADREAASGRTAEAASWAARAYRLPGAAELEADDLKRLVPLLRAGSSPLAKQAEEEAKLLGIPLPPATAPARQAPPNPQPPITSDVRPAAPLPQSGTSFVGRKPTGSGLQSYRRLVRHYVRHHRPRIRRRLDFYASSASLDEAVERAGWAQDVESKRHPHQRRLQRAALSEATARLLSVKDGLRQCQTFAQLFELVEDVIGRVHGVGQRMIYDTAHRLGAYLHLEPERVYLHRGTRTGAAKLGFAGRETLDMHELPPELQELEPHEVEDFLCLYKDEL